MELQKAKEQFIEAWGSLGTQWGISRTMAQIHALMLIAPEPLTTENIMEQLSISRGNANMNTRALMDWGLVEKRTKLGERKEFFVAEKDMWKISTRIIMERRKRELEPIKSLLEKVKQVDPNENEAETLAFLKQIADIEKFSSYADKVLNKVVVAQESWIVETLKKAIK